MRLANGGYSLEKSWNAPVAQTGATAPYPSVIYGFFPIIRIETFIKEYKRFNTNNHFLSLNFTSGEGWVLPEPVEGLSPRLSF
jgi:hypothetical protein